MSGPPPPHLLANYVHPWGPSAKHSSIPACLHANRARVLLPFRVMKVSTSAICVRGQILGDIPGRGSQRVHHRRYRRHDVRRSNFSAARRRRNSPRRPINDHRTFGRSSTTNTNGQLGLNCQHVLKTAQGLRAAKYRTKVASCVSSTRRAAPPTAPPSLLPVLNIPRERPYAPCDRERQPMGSGAS